MAIDISSFQRDRVRTDTTTKGSLSAILNSEITFFAKKFGSKEKQSLYTELGLLLSTGVDVKTAFDIIEEDIIVKAHKSLISSIKNDIVTGKSIYQAFDSRPDIFTRYESQSVRIGEESGKLAEVLRELGEYYDSSIKLRRQIVGVLTYPVVVISMALIIVYFMLAFIVPVFSDIFKQTGGKLPELTQLLIDASKHSDSFFFFLTFLVSGCFIIHRIAKKKAVYRKFTSGLLLKIPVVGKVIQKIYLARFCQSMKLLSGAKVVVNEGLLLVMNMIEYYPIEIALKDVHHKVVVQGKLLNESLSEHSIFPKKLIALIKLSEEINAPEIIFDKLCKQYSDEIQHQQAVVGKLIEPVFIVLLGLFVGFILVAMYLPMFEMSTTNF